MKPEKAPHSPDEQPGEPQKPSRIASLISCMQAAVMRIIGGKGDEKPEETVQELGEEETIALIRAMIGDKISKRDMRGVDVGALLKAVLAQKEAKGADFEQTDLLDILDGALADAVPEDVRMKVGDIGGNADVLEQLNELKAGDVEEIAEVHRRLARPVKPIRNEGPRVGRNDPCPCGSGKKFKQCCGPNR